MKYKKMIKTILIFDLICILNTLVSSSTEQQLDKLFVLKTPNYQTYDFSNQQALRLSDFKNLLLATSGFGVNKQVEWNGLKKVKTTDFPRATVLFLVDNNHTDFNSLGSKFIKIEEDTDSDFGYLHSTSLGYDSETKFYDHLPSQSDVKTLSDVCTHLNSYHVIRIPSSESGDLSKSIEEALNLFLKNCVSDSNDLLAYLLTTSTHSRARRQTSGGVQSNEQNMVTNEAVFYSDQYPAIFNIIFWSSLILALAVFGISYSMWYMDPGLDTVIYRMTSQRIKKDQ